MKGFALHKECCTACENSWLMSPAGPVGAFSAVSRVFDKYTLTLTLKIWNTVDGLCLCSVPLTQTLLNKTQYSLLSIEEWKQENQGLNEIMSQRRNTTLMGFLLFWEIQWGGICCFVSVDHLAVRNNKPSKTELCIQVRNHFLVFVFFLFSSKQGWLD